MMKDAALVQSTVSRPSATSSTSLPPEAPARGLLPEARLAGLPPRHGSPGSPVPQTVLAMPVDGSSARLAREPSPRSPPTLRAAVRARLAR